MWDGTRKLAEGIAQGIAEASLGTAVVVRNAAKACGRGSVKEIGL